MEKAQELVEFALVLPLLVLLLFGAIDLGRLFHATITIANAAREGARYIALYNDEEYAARAAAVREAQDGGINLVIDDVTINCPLTPQGTCQQMQSAFVTVTYDFQLLLGPIMPGGYDMPGSGIRIQRTVEMLVQ